MTDPQTAPAPPPFKRREGCTCDYKYKGLGTLYGMSMGKDWVRMNTAKDCKVHNDD